MRNFELKRKGGAYGIHAVNFIKLGYILILLSALYILRLVLSPESTAELVLLTSKTEYMCTSVLSAALIMTSGAFAYFALP